MAIIARGDWLLFFGSCVFRENILLIRTAEETMSPEDLSRLIRYDAWFVSGPERYPLISAFLLRH